MEPEENQKPKHLNQETLKKTSSTGIGKTNKLTKIGYKE